MRRRLIDRLTDTVVFRVVLLIAGIMVLPVLLLGLLMLPVFVVANETSSWAATWLVVGGVGGLVGWLRAGWGTRNPERHSVTATLLCLWIGVATALEVGGGIAVALVVSYQDWWSLPPWPVAVFAAAHGLWALEGIGWAQRLTRTYAEHTGEVFDTLPALLLFVAVGLAATAGLVTTTL